MDYEKRHQGRSYIVGPTLREGRPKLIVFALKCGSCGEAERHALLQESTPEEVFKSFRDEGWLVNERDQKHCLCPTCQIRKAPRRGLAWVPNITQPNPELVALKRELETVRGFVRDIDARIDAAMKKGAAA